MKTKKSAILGLTLAMMMTTAVPARAAASPLEVLHCMQANVPDALRVQELEFETSNATGVLSVVKGRLYLERELAAADDKRVRAMLKLHAPQNLSGAAYLVREKDGEQQDGMYVYLPSVKRVRRVTGSFADSGLMGTSFSYADFRLLQNSFDGAELSLDAAELIENRPVHRLRVRPSTAKPKGGYGNSRLWVDQESCVLLKAEFEQDGVVRKRLSAPVGSLQKVGAHWYAAVVEMYDDKEKIRTVLRIRNASAEEHLSGGYFDPKTFYQR